MVPGENNFFYFQVANKIDQEHLRSVKSERHHKFAQVCLLQTDVEASNQKSC